MQSANNQLGEDLDFQPGTAISSPLKPSVPQSASIESTKYLPSTSDIHESLSSRMLTHNTLAHKLEIMKRNSKRSAVFYRKTNQSILSPEQHTSQFSQKLITTPSIPMPERFYYEQNPQLQQSKLQTISDK